MNKAIAKYFNAFYQGHSKSTLDCWRLKSYKPNGFKYHKILYWFFLILRHNKINIKSDINSITLLFKVAVSKEYGVAEDTIQIEDLKVTPGSKVGEGFVCEIAAIRFNTIFKGEKIEKNYIAKYAPDGPKGDFIREVKMWPHIKNVF